MYKMMLSAVMIATLSAGCAIQPTVKHDTSPQLQPLTATPLAQAVVDTDIELLWQQGFGHYRPGLLKQVASKMLLLSQTSSTDDKALDKLSYYLRIYASFGPEKDWLPQSAEMLDAALVAMTHMPDFFTISEHSARLHENYAAALYRLYALEPMRGFVKNHIATLAQLLRLYASSELGDEVAYDWAMWEVLRAAALLPYEARQKNAEQMLSDLAADGIVAKALVEFISARNAVRKAEQWPRSHALWALAHHYNLFNKQYWNRYYQLSEDERKRLDEEQTSLPVEQKMKALDEQVWQALSGLEQSADERKSLYSVPYVVNTFRGKSECNEGELKGRCIAPTIEQALPIKHVCSDSLYILAQQMTAQQLAQSCQRLTSQEASFHQKLATAKQPVANDFNDSLRVVIFNDQAQYNIYGQLVFDIYTDNGGMYIEGTPQDPDNIATFYSYEQFWAQPAFKVWNLNHEYVHYLDGRFIKYDTYGHFPSHMVWWSEGLAEYIAFGDDNHKTTKLLAETAVDDFLTLQQVFDTEYKDGTKQVYQWGYLAVRFMYEQAKPRYHKLAHYLKTDYFEGYKSLLEQTGKEHEQAFADWLTQMKGQSEVAQNSKGRHKPRQLYRYSYRQYLQPSYLKEDIWHRHWQYWHQNQLL